MACKDFATELGFLEKVHSSKLEAVFFPSKVGGKPAWLSQDNLPSLDQLECPKCRKRMTFLLQVYAPVDGKEECFHRTIYVFVCINSDCSERNSNDSFKVFRSQLPRENKFFAFEPIHPEAKSDEIKAAADLLRTKCVPLCNICGYPADQKCSACKTVYYCCKEHQVFDWKNFHRYRCCGASNSAKGWCALTV